MKNKKTVAVHVQSEVQFYAVEPLLRELEKRRDLKVTILIERHDSDEEGWKEMSVGTIELMRGRGFLPEYTEDFEDFEFDLCLTPYMSSIRAKCYLKYDYGTLNAKPVLTYVPAALEGFHGLMCPSMDGLNLLAVYGKTFPVDNLRFYGKKRRINHGKKKIVLFAPTYNDKYAPEEDVKIIKTLKDKYYVIVKSHHGTNYLRQNEKKKNILRGGADEYYGSDTNIIDLMMRADVCLSGNSSTIGDAIRAGVPCAVYTHDLDCFKWKDLHTTQYELYKNGRLLACKKIDQVEGMIDQALTKEYREQWAKLADMMFPSIFRTGVEGYLRIIDYFLSDAEAEKYMRLHDYYIEDWKEKVELRDKEIAQREEEIRCLKIEMARLKTESDIRQGVLDDFAKRKLYKIADKIYKLEGKILRVKD